MLSNFEKVTRTFHSQVKDISRTKEIPAYNEWILKTRLDSEHFNLQDSFNCYGTRTETIEIIYTLFETELQELFFQLVGKRFEWIPGNIMGNVKFSDGEAALSSGYQAIVRILLELLYFDKVQKKSPNAWIIIDELDEFLSPKYAMKIWDFLKQNFPQYYFVVTTHSSDLLIGAQNANLIALMDDGFEVRDINDYDSSSSVQMVFERVFETEEKADNTTFYILQSLLNKKLNGAWSQMEEEELAKIRREKLTASQNLIYKQIQEW